MRARQPHLSTVQPLHERIAAAFAADEPPPDALASAEPVDLRDGLLALSAIHDLHLAPLDRVGPAVRLQHHPAISALKQRLEAVVIALLEPEVAPVGDVDAVAELRAIAARELVPAVYDWLATDATVAELVDFLALEGGPDAGFDDLVAACQIGLGGRPKLEMARNYWDEMGRGTASAVHTELHHRLVRAVDMRRIPRAEQPASGLLRSALGGLLATNRCLQPELVGALGLIELQAGPRCRKVIRAMQRLGMPADARAFYDEHAVADPRHGKGWLDEVVAPLAEDPTWAAGIVRGAAWRAEVNRAFFADLRARFVPLEEAVRRAS